MSWPLGHAPHFTPQQIVDLFLIGWGSFMVICLGLLWLRGGGGHDE